MPGKNTKPPTPPQMPSFTPPTSEAFNFTAATVDLPTLTFDREARPSYWEHSDQQQETVAAPQSPVPTPYPDNRVIAPLRTKKSTAEEISQARSKEAAWNVEKMRRDYADLKQELKEEQITKQHKIDEQQKQINEWQKTITEALQSAEYHKKAFEGQQQEVATFRKEYDFIQKTLLKKMAEDKQQQATIKELQSKNEALETMAENQPGAKVEELQNSIDILEQKNDALNTEFDSMQIRLEAAEKKLTETTVAFRHAQNTIANNDATIKNLERQIGENEEQINNLQHELGQRENRIRKRDDEITNRVAEVANLNSLNKQLRQENRRLKSQNDKLELQVQDNNGEIEALLEASRDYQELEAMLAEVQATAAQHKNQVASLEQANTELKARLDENPHSLAGPSGTVSNLESELAESDFAAADDETLFTLNYDNVGDDSAEITASPVVTASADVTNSPEVTQSPVVTNSPEVITSPDITVSLEVTRSPEVTQSPAVTQSPEITQSPIVAASPETTQSPEIIRSPVVTNSPEVTKTDFVKALPIVILKSHNPLDCWLQVYVDLWILFVFWLKQHLTIPFNGQSIVSSAGSVVQDGPAFSHNSSSSSNGLGDIAGDLRVALVEGEHTDAPLPAAVSGYVASVVTTTAQISMDHEELTPKLPDFRITILAFCFHILFYTVVIVCVSNYRAVLYERSVWLKANEITRQYLHQFHIVPYKREYGKFHELFGPVRFLNVWRYNVHNWAKVSRSLPG